ncbi:hypothetical protein V6V47_19655 [Micromonospora sp. CPCC 205539]|uniref:LppU/SCO3897 family protein n=1 Tax=Micromonospora sp. CPCC 205539 TaxID=3122408 RepID=UPI002FF14D4D
MSEQVAPPPASDAAQPQPAVETPPSPAVETPSPVEPEAKKSGAGKVLGIVGAIVVIVIIGALKFGIGSLIGNALNKDETADAKAGDCIAELPEVNGTEEEEANNAKVVECTSTDAAYSVVGRVEGQTEAQAKEGAACQQYLKEGQEGYLFYSIKPGKTGYLLCLTKKA